jgi:hypothetical protein
MVGNGSRLPIAATGTVSFTSRPFHLHNVLVAPQLVKNLISTRQFSRHNFCSVEFDPYGFSLKDLATLSSEKMAAPNPRRSPSPATFGTGVWGTLVHKPFPTFH